MSEAEMHAPSRSASRRFTLNSDGKPHPWINGAGAYALAAGIVSMVMGLISANHIVGAALGVSAFLIGLWAQMVSVTREQRMLIVCGIVAAFVGMGIAIAHGGFG